MPTFAIPNETNTVSKHAEVAQLVEHNLAKVGVASSSLVFRSKNKKSAEMLTFVLKISPDGVQSYVSRPCAQGTAFLFYVYSLPCTHMHFPDYQAQQDKKDRPPKRAIWNMMQPEGLLERGTRKHYCILSITVNYQRRNERHGIILHREIE